ncbi:MAG: tRNA-binding protein [Proteobacteria bacterium]|nr:MAG: tRNA-binding protein [Pseudomonadota bacterium]
MLTPVEFSDFTKIEMRVGKIIAVEPNHKAKVPAYILKIDFGTFGIKISSAQLTANYQLDDLLDKHVVCVMNLIPKRVAGIKSEVLVLGALSSSFGTKLISVDMPIELGSKIG